MASERKTTRRAFLKTAAWAAAAPAFVPASALGAEGRRPASDRIGLGCIGVGNMGGGHLSGLIKHPDVEIAAVCEVDAERLESARQRAQLPSARAFRDFREVLERPEIDAVLIATPDHWHAPMSIAAMKAGKDVYCEKPLTLTIGEGRKMVEAARRYGRICQTGSQQRSAYEGKFRFACELIRNGYIGQLKTALVKVGGPSAECFLPAEPTPEGMNWDMWLGPAPARPFHKNLHPKSWRAFRDYSGGAMTDWGAHHFDIVQWALDMDESGPVEIFPPDGKEHPCLTFRYANGVTAQHVYGPGAARIQYPGEAPSGNSIVFVGDKGWIEVSRSKLRTYPESLASVKLKPGEIRLFASPGHQENFLQCMRSRQRPICDVEIGCRSVSVCHLGNIAYWLNRPLRWNPKEERFIGDAEAGRWIERPRRAPYDLI